MGPGNVVLVDGCVLDGAASMVEADGERAGSGDLYAAACRRAASLAGIQLAHLWRSTGFFAWTLFCKSNRCPYRQAGLRALSRLASSLGGFLLLREIGKDGGCASTLRTMAYGDDRGRDGICLMALSKQDSSRLGAVLDTDTVLRVLGGLRFRSHLYSGMVSAFLLQHTLWHGTAAGIRAVSRF